MVLTPITLTPRKEAMKAATTTQALGLSATLLLAGGALVPAFAQD